MKRELETLRNIVSQSLETSSLTYELNRTFVDDPFWGHLNKIFINEERVENHIASLLESYKVKPEFEKIDFEEARREYFSNLAMDYCNDDSNPSIEALLKKDNKVFREEVSFQEEIREAIILSEREKLRKCLAKLDLPGTVGPPASGENAISFPIKANLKEGLAHAHSKFSRTL